MASVEQYGPLPAVVAGVAQTIELGIVAGHGGEEFALGEARLATATAQAAQGTTNYATLSLQYLRAGAGVAGAPVVMATLNLGTQALVANVAKEFTYVAQEVANLVAGDVLQLTATHTGTGGALAAGAIVEIERD